MELVPLKSTEKTSGIQLLEVTERSLAQKKKGRILLSLTLEQENDAFDVNIDVSKNGICDVSVYHPRLDPIRYRGEMTRLK